MTNMKCFECLFKHLAGALSYGKQIMSGHGEGADLDHRIDFLGELVNAEHHAELIDKDLVTEMKTFRSGLQGRGLTIDETTLEVLRQLYLKAQGLQNANKDDNKKIVIPDRFEKRLFTKRIRQQEAYSIIIDKVNNEKHFDLCVKLLKKNFMNKIDDIIVLNPSFSVSEQFKVIHGKMMDVVKNVQLTDNFIYMKQDYYLIHPFDFNYMVPVYTQKTPENKLDLELHNLKYYYSYDSGCPQVMNKKTYLEKMFQTSDVITAYMGITAPQQTKNAHQTVVQLNKKICCSNTGKMVTCSFAVTYNEQAFQSVREWVYQHGILVDKDDNNKDDDNKK